MGDEKIEQILECVFAEESSKAAAGCPFVEMECWDSLKYVYLVASVEGAFGIELNSDQISRITSLHGLCEVLKEHGIAL